MRFEIVHAVVRDLAKHRDTHGHLPLTDNAESAIDDPPIYIIVELIGGTTRHDAGRAGGRAGKSVVTANKSLLASKGPELFSLAQHSNTFFFMYLLVRYVLI